MAILNEVKADFENQGDNRFFTVKGKASSHGPFALIPEGKEVFASGGRMLRTKDGDVEFELYGKIVDVEKEGPEPVPEPSDPNQPVESGMGAAALVKVE